MFIILQHYPNLYTSLCNQGEQKVNRLSAGKSVEAGFSLIELLIAILILMIMTAVSIFPFIAHRNAYRTEDQALRLVNFLEDAKMHALAKQRPMRFEIDLTDRVLRIIDEMDTTADTSDDVIVKTEYLIDSVRLDRQPANMTGILPNVSINATPLFYSTITYSLVGNTVWSARFQSDGTAELIPSGQAANVTIFIWLEAQDNANNADPIQAVRAVTIFGGTSNVRLWQYDGANFQEW